MATVFEEGRRTSVSMGDALLRIEVVERISPERIALMLLRGAVAALVEGVPDETPLVSQDIKDLLLDPRST